eukprot:m.80281 g.80281  ORF g.80281 m.80281 type:complete len:50 (-) comp10889_c0_seq1:1321-1470(-)
MVLHSRHALIPTHFGLTLASTAGLTPFEASNFEFGIRESNWNAIGAWFL